jgi:hypothetical protein
MIERLSFWTQVGAGYGPLKFQEKNFLKKKFEKKKF